MTFRVATIGLAFLFLGSTPFASAQWYRDYDRGKKAFDRGQHQDAIASLERAASSRPEPGHRIVFYGNRIGCYYPYFYLGLSYQAVGRQEACQMLLASVSLGELGREPSAAQRRRQSLDQLGCNGEERHPPSVAAPVIEIYEPVVRRGDPSIVRDRVTVKGKVTAPGGIQSITVNNVEADFNPAGDFQGSVAIALGRNAIRVRAVDQRHQATERSFVVTRKVIIAPPPTLPTPGPPAVPTRFGTYHALLIAVKDYTDRNMNDLDFPIRDAETVKEVLIRNYTFASQNVHTLKNPTRDQIIKKLTELKGRLGTGDNLLIFYGGHGYWDEGERQGYWLPSDATKADTSNWLSNSTIRDKVYAIKTQHTLLISDACFSGGIFKTKEAFTGGTRAAEEIYKLPSRKALTSGAMETVPDRSVFVEYLVKRLKQNNKEYYHAQELFIEMRPAVINNSPLSQKPLFGVIHQAGDEGGDFLFIRRKKES
jgi:hypothetical protein